MTDDELNTIRAIFYEIGFALAERTTIPDARVRKLHDATNALLADNDRLRAEIEKLTDDLRAEPRKSRKPLLLALGGVYD